MSFRHAVELLKAGGFSCSPVKSTTATKLATLLYASVEDQVLLMSVGGQLPPGLEAKSEGTLEYLNKRDLDRPDLIDPFKLRVANRTAYRLPEKNRSAGAEMRGVCSLWACRARAVTSTSNGSLVIPIINHG